MKISPDVFERFRANAARRSVLARRGILFERILSQLQSPTDCAGAKFGQDLLLNGCRLSESLVDVESGVLFVTVDTDYEGFEGKHSYSLFLTGDLLRIGLLLYEGLESAPLIDWHNEMDSLWPGCEPEHADRQGVTLYQWTFLVPDLYDRYPSQERYILGMRHMHARILRIVRDYRISQRDHFSAQAAPA